MVHFLQDGDTKIHMELSEDSTIQEYFDTFVAFLKATTIADAIIYKGLLEATQDIEDSLKLSYKTWRDITQVDDTIHKPCCQDRLLW